MALLLLFGHQARSLPSLKHSCSVVHRKLGSHTRTAETSDSGDPRALCLHFLSDPSVRVILSSAAQHPPYARARRRRPLTVLLKGRD